MIDLHDFLLWGALVLPAVALTVAFVVGTRLTTEFGLVVEGQRLQRWLILYVAMFSLQVLALAFNPLLALVYRGLSVPMLLPVAGILWVLTAIWRTGTDRARVVLAIALWCAVAVFWTVTSLF